MATNAGYFKKKAAARQANMSDDTITINGQKYQKVNTISITYSINHNQVDNEVHALVDRGANGGVAGDVVRVVDRKGRSVHLTGLDNHQVCDLPVCMVAAYGRTHKGPVIFIMHQYAYLGTGKTIHSSAQLENCKNEVDDRSRKLIGGKRRINTVDGYLIPLDVKEGLLYMNQRPPTDDV
jgi:hypothetical protein